MGRIDVRRSPWLLLAVQGLVTALLVSLNVYVLPRSGWGGTWGPPLMEQTPGILGVEAGLDSRVRRIVRTEIQQAVALQGDSAAMEQLRRFYRMPRQVPPIAGSRAVSPSVPIQGASNVRGFLLPFGLHRPGLIGVGLYLASLITLFGVFVLITYLFADRLRTMRDCLARGWRGILSVGAIGGLGYSVAVVLSLLLAANLVGLPLALLLILSLAPMTLLGLVAFCLALGRWMSQKANLGPVSPVMELAIGVLALFPASIVPILGWVFAGVAAALGFGALLATKFGSEDGWSIESLS